MLFVWAAAESNWSARELFSKTLFRLSDVGIRQELLGSLGIEHLCVDAEDRRDFLTIEDDLIERPLGFYFFARPHLQNRRLDAIHDLVFDTIRRRGNEFVQAVCQSRPEAFRFALLAFLLVVRITSAQSVMNRTRCSVQFNTTKGVQG